jgi:hypothetical protein
MTLKQNIISKINHMLVENIDIGSIVKFFTNSPKFSNKERVAMESSKDGKSGHQIFEKVDRGTSG